MPRGLHRRRGLHRFPYSLCLHRPSPNVVATAALGPRRRQLGNRPRPRCRTTPRGPTLPHGGCGGVRPRKDRHLVQDSSPLRADDAAYLWWKARSHAPTPLLVLPADACLALLVDRLSLSSVIASRLSRTHKDAPNVLNLSYRVRTQLSGPFINCLMWKEGVMIFCCFCSEKLKEGEDIYIYQGDKSFCSMECRENFMVDEMEGAVCSRRE
ncbi:hypothetical protein Zm00014a_026425 [Zea mays]|uniref:FLZ-type domain-containing protein n=1 Tax=Zea mays TaxID=4577 RepID=A0A3L6FD88_MAIZE|nr:hypothetical protein Zm00014a_026425 [Zea mays]